MKEKGKRKKAGVQEFMPLLTGLSGDLQSCAFSGHREIPEDLDVRKLKEIIRDLAGRGATTFYFGGARGFDLLAAECVLALKREMPEVTLVACIPCGGQEKYYPEEDKKRYARALEESDEVVILSEKYYRGCMHRRNDYMAENADALIACCRKETGGTAYTVKKFRRKGKPVFGV